MKNIFWGAVWFFAWVTMMGFIASPVLLMVYFRNPEWLWLYSIVSILVFWKIGDEVGSPFDDHSS